jgi:PAS domain S-box-containing protein
MAFLRRIGAAAANDDSERRFRAIADAAPVMIWISDATKACTWFNRPWLDFTGRGLRDEVGDGWMHDVHPDDLRRCIATYHAAFDERRMLCNDFRLRRADGAWRVIEDIGMPRFAGDGEFLGYVGACVDVTDQRAAQQALRQSEEQLRFARATEARLREREEHLRAVVDNSPECVKLVARDGTLLQMNPSGLAMVGARDASAVVGRSTYDLLAPEYRDAYRAFNERVCDGARETLEFDVIALTGQRHHMETHGVPLHLPSGETVQLALTRDVTARRQAEEALRDADRRKDEFIATLSHELRNPLAPLASALSVARMADMPGSQAAQMHEIMERQLDHLVRLVDDLLEVSRISHGVLELRHEPVEVAAVVRNAVETSRTAIDAAAHELVLSLPPESAFVDGDAVRLAQVLGNLLDNAVRFMAPGGRIDLEVQAEAQWIEIAVRDRGAGFEPEAGEALFRMFGRGRGSDGLGIGLALARKLAQMHGGTLDATSEGHGRGAHFTLRLPRIAAPSAFVASSVEANEEASIAGKRILVVDDNRDAAESLRMMLELLGADVQVAYNGRDAIARFAECQPVAMLLDIGMPGMDGYEVAREIRARADGTSALIVALTGWGQEDDRRRSREAGFDHHLVKPADLETLERVLASTRVPTGMLHEPQLASLQ